MIELGVFQLLVELAGIHQLTEWFDSLQGLDEMTLLVIGIVTLIIGLLQCFCGYKLIKMLCGFVGLIIGCFLGAAVAAALAGVVPEGAMILVTILCVVLLGITGAFIASRAYIVGVFLYAFFAAFFAGYILFALITSSALVGLIAGLIAGVALGVVAVVFRRFWVISASSIQGGITAAYAAMLLLQSDNLPLHLGLTFGLIAAGFVVQFLTTKKKVKAPVAVTVVNPVYAAAITTPVQPEDPSPATEAPQESAPASPQESTPPPAEAPADSSVEAPPQTDTLADAE